MPLLETATLAISPDEPAFRLREVNLTELGRKGLHRYQVIEVVRGDRLVEWRDWMGPAELFPTRQFQIIGGWVNPETGKGEAYETVGTLREMADQMRSPKDDPWPEDVPLVDWEQEYHDHVDRDRKARRKESIFGPHYRRMRY